tara:strand:- start:488 stop:1195 length:708 start_codon:yes stop_codon:yes gene_type:complete
MSELKLENISLNYPIYNSRNLQLRKKIFGKIEKDQNISYVDALNDVSLDLKDGDRVSIIGPNGAGKSTLLKVAAGIYPPTKGLVKCSEVPYTILDISMGLMDDADGIENIYYVSYLRGFSDKFINDKIDWIIEFSGLENAINREIRTYSSGMKVRLAVSILLSQDPKIIILDEFFGAGDKNFQDKCADRLEKIISKSGLVLFASHDEGLVNKISTKIIHMDKGKIIKIEDKINEK